MLLCQDTLLDRLGSILKDQPLRRLGTRLCFPAQPPPRLLYLYLVGTLSPSSLHLWKTIVAIINCSFLCHTSSKTNEESYIYSLKLWSKLFRPITGEESVSFEIGICTFSAAVPSPGSSIRTATIGCPLVPKCNLKARGKLETLRKLNLSPEPIFHGIT